MVYPKETDMGMHVVIVGANSHATEAIRNAVQEKVARSEASNTVVVRSYDRCITVSTIANLDGALREVERTKPMFVFALPSFFTDRSDIDPMAWARLLHALVTAKYRGVLGVVREAPLPGWPETVLHAHQLGCIKVVQIDPKRIRDMPRPTPGGQAHNRMRLETV